MTGPICDTGYFSITLRLTHWIHSITVTKYITWLVFHLGTGILLTPFWNCWGLFLLFSKLVGNSYLQAHLREWLLFIYLASKVGSSMILPLEFKIYSRGVKLETSRDMSWPFPLPAMGRRSLAMTHMARRPADWHPWATGSRSGSLLSCRPTSLKYLTIRDQNGLQLGGQL